MNDPNKADESRDLLIGDVRDFLQEFFPGLKDPDYGWKLQTHLASIYLDTGDYHAEYVRLCIMGELWLTENTYSKCGLMKKFPFITWKVALPLLKTHKEEGKDRVHSTAPLGLIQMGCDVDLSDVQADAKKYGIQIAGPHMMRAGHGLVIVKEGRPIFYEHKKQAVIDQMIAENPL